MRRKCFVCNKTKNVKYTDKSADLYICSDECLTDFFRLSHKCECNRCRKVIEDMSKIVFRYPKSYDHKITYCSMECALNDIHIESESGDDNNEMA